MKHKLLTMLDFSKWVLRKAKELRHEDIAIYLGDSDPYGCDIDLVQVRAIEKHFSFLSQPPKLGDLIECDLEGNILEEPDLYEHWLAFSGDYPDGDWGSCKAYQEAQERVIFEGCEIKGFDSHKIETLKHTDFLVLNGGGQIAFKKDWVEDWDFGEFDTVEDIIRTIK